MSKKILIVVLVVIIVSSGLYFLMSKNSGMSSTKSKFFHQEGILNTDTLVKITDNGFDPGTIIIKAGQRVVWLNETKNYVWPASDPHPYHTGYPGFDPEEPFLNGEVWAFKFDQVGSWGYHNHLKPSERAKVIVTN